MLSSVVFAEDGSMTDIGNSAFNACMRLENLDIPEGVRTVGSSAFFNCSYLKELHIPSTMQMIGDNAPTLLNLVKDDVLFIKDGNMLLFGEEQIVKVFTVDGICMFSGITSKVCIDTPGMYVVIVDDKARKVVF